MFFLVIGCILLVWCPLAATELWVDMATFQGSEGGTEVSVSVKLSTDSLGVLSTADGDRATVSFRVTVQDSSGMPLLSDTWERLLAPPPDSAGHDVYFLDSSTLEMPPGTYMFSITAADRARDRTYEVSRQVSVPAYAAPGLMLSDMLLSSSPPQQEELGQFVRSGFRIVPSPDRVFGAAGPMMYVYQEIYNLAPRPTLADSYSLTYTLLDRSGREVRTFGTGGHREEGGRTTRISGLSIAGIPPGRYDVLARVEDPITGLRAHSACDIQIVAARTGTGVSIDLTEEQVQKSRDLLAYLASTREQSLYESLDDPGKDNFIKRFWMQRDPDPGVAGNAYLDEMMRRYDYANEHYIGHTPGWRTDRGRVYIIYGPPKELERNISNPGTRDHEIWTYAIEGQGKFIFVDERGYGEYRLVHSTVRGEIENDAWEDLLEPIRDDH